MRQVAIRSKSNLTMAQLTVAGLLTLASSARGEFTYDQLRGIVREELQRGTLKIRPAVLKVDEAQRVLEYDPGDWDRSGMLPGCRTPLDFTVEAQLKIELTRRALSSVKQVSFWESRLQRPEQLVGNMLANIESGQSDRETLLHNARATSLEVERLLTQASEDFASAHKLTLRKPITKNPKLEPIVVTILTDPKNLTVEMVENWKYEFAQAAKREPEWLTVGGPVQLLGEYRFRIGGRALHMVDSKNLAPDRDEFVLTLKGPG